MSTESKREARTQTGEFVSVQALIAAVAEQATGRGWNITAKVTRDEIRQHERHSECEFEDAASGRKVVVDCMPAIADLPFNFRFYTRDGADVFLPHDMAASVSTAQATVVRFLVTGE